MHCGTKMRLWGGKRRSGTDSKDVLTAGGVINVCVYEGSEMFLEPVLGIT